MYRFNTYRACFKGYLFILLMLATMAAQAQQSKRIYKTTLMYDTLVASSNKDFLYNNITITNLTSDKISVLVNIQVPQGWQLITQHITTYTLNANENTTINVRLLPANSKTADWQKVKIDYRLNSGIETTTDTFRVRVAEFIKYKAYLPASTMALPAYQKTLSFPVYVKNSGNTAGDYTVHYTNSLLQLDYKTVLRLNPNQDTVYRIPLRLTEGQWSMLRKEQIKVLVTGPNGETINLIQELSKIGYLLKDHSSAYLDMPLQLEAGSTYQGGEDFQYYGALHGSLDLTPQDHLALDLRSNTYSKGQVANNMILRGEYTGAKWMAVAGTVQELTDFVMDGYGAKLGYKWDERNKAELYGMGLSRVGDSKLIGGNVHIGVTDQVKMTESATANFDVDKKLNGYIFKQAADYRFSETGRLSVVGGVGMEQSYAKLTEGTKSSMTGTSFGYNFQWGNKRFNVMSNVLYNSNSYPGIFKGQRMQNHDARVMFRNIFVGGFYDYNFRKQNMYVDTTLFSDVFNLQTENYGVRTGMSYKGSNVVLSAGRQLQIQTDSGMFQHYRFDYVNLNLAILLFKRLSITTNSYFGQGSIQEKPTAPTSFIMSNQGNIQYRFAGVSLRYDKGPYYYHEYIAYAKTPQQYERIIFSPFADVNLFRNALSIRAQFNYAKSKPDNVENSSLLTNIVYANAAHGFDVFLSSIVPLNQQGKTTPYISASVRVRLHAPFVPIRKYYQLKMILFKDANSNGIMDAGEQPIMGQMVSLNGNNFVSDERGYVIFQNIDKGNFNADFGLSSKMKGWIPNDGTRQQFAVRGNEIIYVPYKMSKVLQGKLVLHVDSNSNTKFSLANIKVTASSKDSLSTFSTITDEEGEFYFNLPSGNYIITLSEGAFDENFQPTQFAQPADLVNNNTKDLFFDIKQKKRQINIRKK